MLNIIGHSGDIYHKNHDLYGEPIQELILQWFEVWISNNGYIRKIIICIFEHVLHKLYLIIVANVIIF